MTENGGTRPYRRVMLKISGQSLGHEDGSRPLSAAHFHAVADQIGEISRSGIECVAVVGGGNLFRGNEAGRYGISNETGDAIGMIATGMNATLLEDLLQQRGCSVVYNGRGPAGARGVTLSSRQMRAALSRQTVVLIAGGSGRSGVSSDVPAVEVAAAVKADVVIMSKYGVSGVLTSDPRSDPGAIPIAEMTTAEALHRDLRFADRQALELLQLHGLPLRVVGASDDGALVRAALGESIGSLISPSQHRMHRLALDLA